MDEHDDLYDIYSESPYLQELFQKTAPELHEEIMAMKGWKNRKHTIQVGGGKMEKKELIRQALEQATPAQLLRARAIISTKQHKEYIVCREQYERDPDQSPTKELSRLNDLIKAFDRGEYNHPDMAELLSDKDLGEALR